MEKLSLVRMTAGNFGCFCFFLQPNCLSFGFYILLGIAAKGDIQYLAQFFQTVKTVDPLPPKEKKKKMLYPVALAGTIKNYTC